MLAFGLLLGIAVPLALVAAPVVARAVVRPANAATVTREEAVHRRGRLLVGASWACFGASFGLAIGAAILLVQDHPTAALVGAAIGLVLAAVGLALAIAGTRRTRRPDRFVVAPQSEMPTIAARTFADRRWLLVA